MAEAEIEEKVRKRLRAQWGADEIPQLAEILIVEALEEARDSGHFDSIFTVVANSLAQAIPGVWGNCSPDEAIAAWWRLLEELLQELQR